MTELGIVIPVYNEAETLPIMYKKLMETVSKIGCTYKILCVDDGSDDNTFEIIQSLHKDNNHFIAIRLSRNFGKEAALSAGLNYINAKAVIVMDADMQDPPTLIPQLMEKWREGYDVVYAKRKTRHQDSYLKKFSAWSFYNIINWISEIPIPRNGGDFRLIDRRVVEILNRLPERTRFMKGLFAWVGFKQTWIFFDRPSRVKGSSKWSYWGLWNFALRGITTFSTFPIRMSGYLGLLVSFGAILYALVLIFKVLIYGIDVPGYASLMVGTLFLNGVILTALGVMGEYIGNIFNEVKQRPIYIVEQSVGINLNSG